MTPIAILVATDGSPEALAAAEWLDRWAQPERTKITVVTVITPPGASWTMGTSGFVIDGDVFGKTLQELFEEEKELAKQSLANTRAQLSHCPPVKEEVLAGSPAKAIVEYAKKYHMDLIVMGRRGHSALGNLMGSVSFGVLNRSSVPVTVVS